MTTATKEAPVVLKAADLKTGIKQEIHNMAAVIIADAKVGEVAEGGTAVVTTGKDLYERLLPEGLTLDIVQTVHDHHLQLAAAGTLAAGEIGLAAMKKDKKLNRVDLEIPATGKDSFGFQFDRSRQVPDRSPGNTGGTREKFGMGTTSFNMYGVQPKGQVDKVKKYLSQSAAEAFEKLGKK